jgi:hypothetical protein
VCLANHVFEKPPCLHGHVAKVYKVDDYWVFDPGGKQKLQSSFFKVQVVCKLKKLLHVSKGSVFRAFVSQLTIRHMLTMHVCHTCKVFHSVTIVLVGWCACTCSTAHNQENTFTCVAEDSTTSSTYLWVTLGLWATIVC